MDREAVEISVPHEWGCGTRGLTVHRSRDLTSKDIVRRSGFPVTTLVRTLVDLASVLDDKELEIALESAIRRNVDLGWLRRRIAQLGTRGRAGAQRLDVMAGERYGRDESPDSTHEVKLLRLLRDAGFPEPVLHCNICDGPYHVAEVDFAFPEQRVAIEATSFKHHSGKRAWTNDAERLSKLAALHGRVVLVTWDDVDNKPDEVIARIGRAMGPRPEDDGVL
jgi:hypothetical protein